MLRVLGCDDAQGYFMSKPLESRMLATWIRANDQVFETPNTVRLRTLRGS
jgi:hypothetical protein